MLDKKIDKLGKIKMLIIQKKLIATYYLLLVNFFISFLIFSEEKH